MKVIKITVLLAVLMFFGTCAYAADCNSGGRYEDNHNNGTVTDCRTGLIWLRNAKCLATSNSIENPVGYLTWNNAMKWVAGLQHGLCNLLDGSDAGDWRLPTKTEWMAMVAYAKKQMYTDPALTEATGTAQCLTGCIFTDVQASSVYWSSTTTPSDSGRAWYVYIYDGSMTQQNKSGIAYVWPVRGGQAASFGTLRIE
jgi:hypothetical protein